MPMLITSVKRSPLAALIVPPRTPSAKAPMRSRTSRTSGMTSLPLDMIALPGVMLRSAMCSTLRFSVTLTLSPANRAVRRSSSPAATVRSYNSAIVSSDTRCLE